MQQNTDYVFLTNISFWVIFYVLLVIKTGHSSCVDLMIFLKKSTLNSLGKKGEQRKIKKIIILQVKFSLIKGRIAERLYR